MIHAVEQRSPAWHLLRAPNVGGSQASAVVSTGRNGTESVGRRDLRVTMALGRCVGSTPTIDAYTNADMARGIELEPVAIRAWEMMSGLRADTVGYYTSDSQPYVGCSPDAIVCEDGVLEVKAPKPALHLAYLRLARTATGIGGIPLAYRPQLLHTFFAMSGRTWIDFVSYSEAFPFEMQVSCVRVRRADTLAQIDEYAEALRVFLTEVDATVAEIQTYHSQGDQDAPRKKHRPTRRALGQDHGQRKTTARRKNLAAGAAGRAR